MNLEGTTGLLTGAAGGLGSGIARRLASEGVTLVLSGRDEASLEELRQALPGNGHSIVAADLSDRDQAGSLIARVEEASGPIDLLVNNAGIEMSATFHKLDSADLIRMTDLNLLAPMLLTHAVIPGMLERGRGHVVQISSLAGLVSTACSEPDAATKGGLLRFTESLRATYVDQPIGFSAVCPGFTTGGGMYSRMEAEGHRSNGILGTSTVEDVAGQVVKAAKGDKGILVSNNRPVRPIAALSAISPPLAAKAIEASGANAIFRRLAADREA